MKIAILGTRGIPANYGGFETFAEELSVRLAQRGHEVVVYCRTSTADAAMKDYRGVRRVVLPCVHSKHLETLTHTFVSTLHLTFAERGADAAFYCNSANACWIPIPRLTGTATLMNPDGLEWERAKWDWRGKAFYRASEHLAARFPHMVVSDSRTIQRYYKEKFGRDSEFVAYGADIVERGFGAERLERFEVDPEGYFLYVSRLEPENNAHVVVEAFEGVHTDKKLLVVGGAPYADEYIDNLKATQDQRIRFPGAVYGEEYKALRANAYVYVNAMEVGGTHPAILEAMGAGNCVLVSDIAYNTEAVAEAGVTFRNKDAADLREKMQHLVDHPELVREYGEKARERVRTEYDWEHVTDEYERIFQQMTEGRRG
jgi:glycosyltransferase involved in cell wall biosynthesis